MTKFSFIVSIGGVLLLTGCSGLTGPGLSVEWRTEPIALGALSRPVRVETAGGVGSITVRGDRELQACRTLERRAVRRGSTITLRLEYGRPDRSCIPENLFVAYEAVIRGVETGTYTLRVEYISDIRAPENPVLEQSVRVQ